MTNESNGSVNDEKCEAIVRGRVCGHGEEAHQTRGRSQEMCCWACKPVNPHAFQSTSTGSVKAEETEGAKEDLGVGMRKDFVEERCRVCGLTRHPTDRYGHPFLIHSSLVNPEAHQFVADTSAPPSPTNTTPNSIPDQVLTPLSAGAASLAYRRGLYANGVTITDAEEGHFRNGYEQAREAVEAAIRAPLEAALVGVQWSAHDEYGDLMCPECEGYMPGQKPGTLNVHRRGTGHQGDCSVAAALAGVPKEAK